VYIVDVVILFTDAVARLVSATPAVLLSFFFPLKMPSSISCAIRRYSQPLFSTDSLTTRVIARRCALIFCLFAVFRAI